MIDWLLGADGLMAPAGAVLPYMALAARGETCAADGRPCGRRGAQR